MTDFECSRIRIRIHKKQKNKLPIRHVKRKQNLLVIRLSFDPVRATVAAMSIKTVKPGVSPLSYKLTLSASNPSPNRSPSHIPYTSISRYQPRSSLEVLPQRSGPLGSNPRELRRHIDRARDINREDRDRGEDRDREKRHESTHRKPEDSYKCRDVRSDLSRGGKGTTTTTNTDVTAIRATITNTTTTTAVAITPTITTTTATATATSHTENEGSPSFDSITPMEIEDSENREHNDGHSEQQGH